MGGSRSTRARIGRIILVVLTLPAVAIAGAAATRLAATPSAVGEPQGRYGESAFHQHVVVSELPEATPPDPPFVEPEESEGVEPGSSDPAPNTVPLVDRVLPDDGGDGGPSIAALAAAAPAAPLVTAASIQQQTTFAGINNTGWTPPDTTMGIGPTSILEMVNASGRVLDKTNGTTLKNFSLASLFGPPTIPEKKPGHVDPKVLYDAQSGRFFASEMIIDQCDPAKDATCTTKGNTEVDVAVSDTSDPMGGWSVYVVDTTSDHTVLDQPKIGVSDDKVVVTINTNGFGGPYQFIVLQKSELLSAAATVAAFFFAPDTTHYNLIPAHSLSSTTTEYAVSTRDGSSTLSVFAFTGTPNAANVASTTTNLAIGKVEQPPNVDQQTDPRQLDTGPAGMQSAVWENGVLWASGNDKCTPSGDSAARSCLRLEHVSTAGTPSIVDDFDVSQFGGHLLDPAVVNDPSGNVFVGHSVSSSSMFATAGETFIPAGPLPSSFAGVDYASGSGPYNCTFCVAPADTRNRWGDYSGAARDPNRPEDICVAEEFGSTSTTNTNDWGTEIGCFTARSATTTTLTSSVNPSVFGQSVTFTATVAPDPPGSVAPTGSVQFFDGTTSLGTGMLDLANPGHATLMTSTLAIGNHPITAVYVDDANFTGSTSATLIQVVNKASVMVLVTSSANPSGFGDPVVFTATVTAQPPASGTPTGTVQFSVDGVPLGGPITLVGGVASSPSIASLLPGAHAVLAVYSGDTNFFGGSGGLSQVVTCTTTITGPHTGTLLVGPGSVCIVDAQVKGSVQTRPGTALYIANSTFTGSVSSNDGIAAAMCGSTVRGSVAFSRISGVVLIGDGGDDGAFACAGNTIRASLLLSHNTGTVEAGGNVIGASMSLTDTASTGTPPEGVPELEGNQIRASLLCERNTPDPVNDGQPNTVGGVKSGQCKTL